MIKSEDATRQGVVVGAAAALSASIGDFAELYVGNALRPELGLPHPPDIVLWIGCLLGLIGLPLFGFGYRAVARSFADRAPTLARITTIAGIVTGFVGAIVHVYTALLIDRQVHAGAASTDPAHAIMAGGPTLLWLWAITALSLIVASAAFATGHGRRFGFAHPLTLLNPFSLTLLLAVIGGVGTWGAAFLQPAAPNLAHMLFFVLFLRAHHEARRPAEVSA